MIETVKAAAVVRQSGTGCRTLVKQNLLTIQSTANRRYAVSGSNLVSKRGMR